jgi:CDP-diacylglycerol---serine O-phosphatidyltransferase
MGADGPLAGSEGAAAKKPRARARRFTMLREFTLADVITLANGFAGTSAVFGVMQYLVTGERAMLWVAFVALPLAMVFDYLDGQVARWRRKVSLLGAQLDSLADLVSFGVAPAVLAFAVGMRGGIDTLILIYFVSCGISRLARYNATAAALSDETGKVKYYEGTPIPTSMLLVAVLAVLFWQGKTHASLPFGEHSIFGWKLHPLVFMYFLSGSAMISKNLRIPKL